MHKKYQINLLLLLPAVLYMAWFKNAAIIGMPETVVGKLGLYHAEAVVFVVLLLLSLLLPVAGRLFFYLAAVLYVVLLFDLFSWFSQTKPFHPYDIIEAIEFVRFYPDFLATFGKRFLLKVVLLVVYPLVMVCLTGFALTRGLVTSLVNVRQILVLIFLFVLSTPFVFNDNYPFYNSFFKIVDNYRYDSISYREVSSEDRNALLGESRPPVVRELNGQFKLILLFIIETLPDKYFPDFNALIKQSGNTWLERNARFTRDHFSTFPDSERGTYSIVTGMYPPLDKGFAWKGGVKQSVFLDILHRNNFNLYYLSTAPLDFRDDIEMYRSLGFHVVEDVKETYEARTIVDDRTVWDRSKLYGSDDILVARGVKILANHVASAKPALLAIATQASHAPFQVPPGMSAETDMEKIQANARWQFNKFMEIVEYLEDTGQLDRTLVLLTSDHGIRSEFESRSLYTDAQRLQDVTFRVPFLIAFDGAHDVVLLDVPSSHIDIAPTLLDVLGYAYESDQFHGHSLLRGIPDRSIFFLGGSRIPSSGYLHDGSYHMENRYKNLYLISDRFNFSGIERAVAGDIDQIKRKIRLINRLILDD